MANLKVTILHDVWEEGPPEPEPEPVRRLAARTANVARRKKIRCMTAKRFSRR